jgi:hypothetical protein
MRPSHILDGVCCSYYNVLLSNYRHEKTRILTRFRGQCVAVHSGVCLGGWIDEHANLSATDQPVIPSP